MIAALACWITRRHRWRYGGTGDWTGYIEVCSRCGAVVQIPQ